MRVGIVGGTGKLGSGLAARWTRAGHSIIIGSRDEGKAAEHARALGAQGSDYIGAVSVADVVVLTVPYAAHSEALRAIREVAQGKILIDATVPIRPPKVDQVQPPPDLSAALEAQALLGPRVAIVAALHHVSAAHVADLAHPIDCDVLVASDDANAKIVTMQLVESLGVRALDAGPLVNAIALESLTPVLIHLNRVYRSRGTGVLFTDLPTGSAPERRGPH